MKRAEGQIKASDIADAAFLEVVRQFNDGQFPDVAFSSKPFRVQGEGGWAFVWDVADVLGVPGKVAEAKAAKLIKRGLMDGCDAKHWCRGDYELTLAGRQFLDELAAANGSQPPAPYLSLPRLTLTVTLTPPETGRV